MKCLRTPIHYEGIFIYEIYEREWSLPYGGEISLWWITACLFLHLYSSPISLCISFPSEFSIFRILRFFLISKFLFIHHFSPPPPNNFSQLSIIESFKEFMTKQCKICLYLPFSISYFWSELPEWTTLLLSKYSHAQPFDFLSNLI